MGMTIKTNRNWRLFVYRSDVPAKVLHDQFSHLSEDDASDGFFQYRGHWYHLSDFMRIDGAPELAGWDGYATYSAFSGVLIETSKDGERYRVGRYYS